MSFHGRAQPRPQLQHLCCEMFATSFTSSLHPQLELIKLRATCDGLREQGMIKTKPLCCKNWSGGAGLRGGRLKNPQWEKTKRKTVCHPGYEITVQRLRWFGRLNMQDGLVMNEENIIASAVRATWLPVQHTETSLFQKHRFKKTAIKQDMLHSF